MRFESVNSPEEIERLAAMADEIWHEYWPPLIGLDQTDYMVEKFQSLNALTRDIGENGYEYWIIIGEDEEAVGYTGGREESETHRFFISKIYLYDNARGKGYAKKTIRFFEALCSERGLASMYLTVNKGNDLAIRAYKGLGFETIDSVVSDIEGGFVMDDYIMEKVL